LAAAACIWFERRSSLSASLVVHASHIAPNLAHSHAGHAAFFHAVQTLLMQLDFFVCNLFDLFGIHFLLL
jgi:hypothetical protein